MKNVYFSFPDIILFKTNPQYQKAIFEADFGCMKRGLKDFLEKEKGWILRPVKLTGKLPPSIDNALFGSICNMILKVLDINKILKVRLN